MALALLLALTPVLSPESILCNVRSAWVIHADGTRQPLQLLSPWGDGEVLDLEDSRLWQQCQRELQG